MKNFRIDNKGTTRLFENRIFEALTRTYFAVPVIMYSVLAGILLIYAAFYGKINFLHILYLFPAGVLLFTLVEYLIHRFVFHFNPVNEKQEKIKYNIHGVHHEFPRDKDRLVMPPVISAVLAILFFSIFKVLMDDYVYLFYPGFLCGYSIYLLIHYAVHRYRPPQNFLKYYWKHHSLHHYKSDDTAFSVSFPFWDYLFGTMPAKAGQQDKFAGNRLPDSQ
jgi:4-hydroxysphinganine ceramide fatty acyl 2-hydroxylase